MPQIKKSELPPHGPVGHPSRKLTPNGINKNVYLGFFFLGNILFRQVSNPGPNIMKLYCYLYHQEQSGTFYNGFKASLGRSQSYSLLLVVFVGMLCRKIGDANTNACAFALHLTGVLLTTYPAIMKFTGPEGELAYNPLGNVFDIGCLLMCSAFAFNIAVCFNSCPMFQSRTVLATNIMGVAGMCSPMTFELINKIHEYTGIDASKLMIAYILLCIPIFMYCVVTTPVSWAPFVLAQKWLKDKITTESFYVGEQLLDGSSDMDLKPTLSTPLLHTYSWTRQVFTIEYLSFAAFYVVHYLRMRKVFMALSLEYRLDKWGADSIWHFLYDVCACLLTPALAILFAPVQSLLGVEAFMALTNTIALAQYYIASVKDTRMIPSVFEYVALLWALAFTTVLVPTFMQPRFGIKNCTILTGVLYFITAVCGFPVDWFMQHYVGIGKSWTSERAFHLLMIISAAAYIPIVVLYMRPQKLFGDTQPKFCNFQAQTLQELPTFKEAGHSVKSKYSS